MPRSISTLLIAYGLFLALCGAIGFVLTRETSTSSLLNGGVFGSLMAVLGVLGRSGRLWTFPAALSATAIFTLTFLWRGLLQAHAAFAHDQSRWPVVALLVLMECASAIVLITMIRSYRH